MSAQGVFAFCREEAWRPKHPERLFFAVMVEPLVAQEIARVAGDFAAGHGLGGSRVPTSRLHVSLHHIGDYKRLRSATVYAARLAGDAVSLPAFELCFQSIASFGKSRARRPVVLLGPPEPLTPLYLALGAALRRNGLQTAGHFAPHITLLYGPARVPPQAIPPLRVPVKDFVLVHSEMGLTRYHIFQRWKLAIDACRPLTH